jgi:lysophospholipase L1-like esterase
VEALPNMGTGITAGYTTTSPELVYNVNFTSTGTYYVWIRGAAPSTADDSLHAGIDGTAPTTADEIAGFLPGWAWNRTTRDGTPAKLIVPSPGLHTVHLWMREDGMRVDKVLLRKSSSASAPDGAGPSESSTRPRLMALGDSITLGVAGDPAHFGYRDHLEFILGVGEQEFVGTYRDPAQDRTYDVDHEGVGGNTTAQVLDRLPAALTTHMPTPNAAGSRVLLHIGTNDMQDRVSIAAVVDNVEQIINTVHAHDPSINIYVALIIPSTIAADDAVFTDYNNALAARLASLRATTKSNLFTVDMNTAFKTNPSWQTQYMSDAFHPNEAGYVVMAQTWAQAIDADE